MNRKLTGMEIFVTILIALASIPAAVVFALLSRQNHPQRVLWTVVTFLVTIILVVLLQSL